MRWWWTSPNNSADIDSGGGEPACGEPACGDYGSGSAVIGVPYFLVQGWNKTIILSSAETLGGCDVFVGLDRAD